MIAVVSTLYFRHHHLSTRGRIILSLIAVGLMASWQLREGSSLLGAIVIVGFAVFVLGAGIYHLWKSEHEPPEQ